MLPIRGKKVLLGVTGGIAAYKSAQLVRLLKSEGNDVRVVMTSGAESFITPLTLQALSGNPVHTDLLDPGAEAAMGHIELARWADIVLVAPATANFMARLKAGMTSDLLSAVCLATRSKIILAPAMNQVMWQNAITQSNVKDLEGFGYSILGPEVGSQACGEVGPGRMLEPEEIFKALDGGQLLAGKTFTITAGPTVEALDPVRFLSNRSSGKMGYALARAAWAEGATVKLISGPTQLSPPAGLEFHSVKSAEQMLTTAIDCCENTDVFISAAAVADYRPAHSAPDKIKKTSSNSLTLELVKNPDIVATIAKNYPEVFVVGFAAETQNLEEQAKLKRVSKGLDMIVGNDVSGTETGFDSDFNEVVVGTAAMFEALPVMRKGELASKLIEKIADMV